MLSRVDIASNADDSTIEANERTRDLSLVYKPLAATPRLFTKDVQLRFCSDAVCNKV